VPFRAPPGKFTPPRLPSWSITADVEVKADTTGMIITQGGLFSGWALHLDKGKPAFHYNFCDVSRARGRGGGRAATPQGRAR
jgi:arylsulfatase